MKKTFYTLLCTVTPFFLLISNSYGQTYDFNGETPGSSGTLTNGWTCTPSVINDYRWMADTTATTGPGNNSLTGPGGAFAGNTYMVVNSDTISSTTTAHLTSPAIDVTGYTNPGFSFWYHMNGASFGPLIIEASTDGFNWTPLDTIFGPVQKRFTEPWHFKRVDLSGLSSTSTQVRFSIESRQATLGPVAVDLCEFGEVPTEDLGIDSVGMQGAYTLIPISQADSMYGEATVSNYGASTESVSYDAIISSSSGTVTLNSGSALLPPGGSARLTTNQFLPTAVDTYDVTFVVNAPAGDTFSLNDTLRYSFEVTDSVYARERGSFTGGIGFPPTVGGGGRFGQMFTINHLDTLTSVRVNLQSPTIGDSVRFFLYSVIGNEPGNLLDSSDYLEIVTDTIDWYDVNFACEAEMTPGEYFIAVEQVNANNLSFGYTHDHYEKSQCFYSTTGTTWFDFEASDFQVMLGIRPIFGNPSGTAFTFDLGSDTSYCASEVFSDTLNAFEFGATYSWNTGETTSEIVVDSFASYSVTVSKCNVQQSDTLTISELPSPDVAMPQDTFYCEGDQFSYTFSSSTPSASFTWNDNSTSSSYTFDTAGTYSVTATLSNCTDSSEINITRESMLDEVDFGADTVFCEGESYSFGLFAGNVGANHSWSTGSSTSNIVVNSSGTYSVTVTQGGVCPDTVNDTLVVTEESYPDLNLENEGFCEGDGPITLDPGSGYPSYAWSTGDSTETIEVSAEGNYSVTVSTENECTSEDSALVEIYPVPEPDLGGDRQDTNQSVTLEVDDIYVEQFWSTNETGLSIEVDSSGIYWVRVTDDNGCQGYDTVRVDIHYIDENGDTTFVRELELPELNIYPNPASDHLFIEASDAAGEYHIRLLSATGNVVRSTRHYFDKQSRKNIDLNGLSSGLYILQVQQDSRQSVTRIVIK